MADIFRDSPFGQIMRLYFLREMAPFEDERPGFELPKPVSRHTSRSGSTRSEEKKTSSKQGERSGNEKNTPGKRSKTPDVKKNKWGKQRARSESEKDVSDEEEDSDMFSSPKQTRPTKNVTRSSSSSSVSSDSSSDEVVCLVEFTGPKDRDNPHNWSLAKKLFVFFQICLLTFVIYSGTAIMTAAAKIFEMKFGATQQTFGLTLSMYVLGYGLGPFLFSPLSEIPELGRNVSYMTSLALFIVVTAIGAWITNFPAFVVLRLLQGFFGGPVIATGSASATDLFASHKLPYAIAVWAIFIFAAPAGGPAASGFAISLGTWRWGMWELLIMAVFTFVLLFFCLPETNAEYILGQRARRIRVMTQDLSYKTESEASDDNRSWLTIASYHLLMPFKITFLDPSILFINLYTALLYTIYYSFFESFPLVYADIYGWSVGVASLSYLAVLLGGFMGIGIYCLVVKTVYEPYTLKHGAQNPEWRLFPGTVCAALQPVGVFIFGFASRTDINWPAPTVGVVLFAISAFIVLNCIFVYLPMGYPRDAASAFAANGFFRSVSAVASIHFSYPLFNNLGVQNGCAILGSISALYALLFVGLYKYAPTLRSKSTFAE